MAQHGRQLAGEQLQRDDGDQRLEDGRHLRQPDHGAGEVVDHRVVLLGQRDRAGASGADLLDVGDHLVVQLVAAPRRHHDEHRHARLDDGDRAVLELAGGEALGVQVGDLLELEGALEGDRVADVAAEEEHRGLVDESGGEVEDRGGVVQHLLHQRRQALQLLHHRGDLLAVHRPLDLRQVETEQVAGGQLGGEALRRGDADLRAGVGVDHRVGLARDGRTVGVADGQHPGVLFAGVPDGHQGVGGLAGLGDRHHQGGRADDRVAVAELGGQLHLAGDPHPVLDGVLGDHPGVEGRAGGDDDDLLDLAQLRLRQPDLVEGQRTVLGVAAQQGVGDGLRLLEDLLAHEPVETALLGGGQIPVDVVALGLGRLAGEVGHLHPVGGDLHHRVLAEFEGLAGVLDERGDIGGEEVLPLAQADDQRGVAAGGDHPVGRPGVDGDQGEGALEPVDDGVQGVEQGRPLGDLDTEQLRGDLGVGLGAEGDALGGQLGAQLGEVLDDAVVHDGDPAVLGQVRVRVAVGGGAVGGPAGVADAGAGLRQRVLVQGHLEVQQLAGLLLGGDPPVGHDGHTGRVVAAVLEAPEPLDDDLTGAARPDIPHDSTHGDSLAAASDTPGFTNRTPGRAPAHPRDGAEWRPCQTRRCPRATPRRTSARPADRTSCAVGPTGPSSPTRCRHR
ncbi:hypothetical protein SDC9_62099 [bioreactor metagenome]|uniref:Uncharacterized protein n=1 Tax=bioreactor metagenome TaxID=1076179 RepID=A0A644XIF5_9ZZZZ